MGLIDPVVPDFASQFVGSNFTGELPSNIRMISRQENWSGQFRKHGERLKNLGGGNYWKELLDNIRDIRSSEKVMYRQVLDLYATAIDYNPKAPESITFFKIVQNNE